MALVGALYVPAQAQTAGAAAPFWPGPQGAGPLPAANSPVQARLLRPRPAASAQTASSAYTESVLYGFSGFCTQPGCANGTSPEAGLIEDASGNLYGTTSAGGSSNLWGTVFKLTPNGDGGYGESVLYNFCTQGGTSCTDGEQPVAGLIEDTSGNLYGTTEYGGANGGGTVFKLTPSGSGYTESVLYSFCAQGGTSCTDGASPLASLIEDASGNLYGTTWHGGATIPNGGSTTTGGTVFELAPNGDGTYSESVLYTFCTQSACTDGEWPVAGLIEDTSGDLYGTTSAGGATITVSGNTTTGGTVFKLTPKGDGSYSESVLYSFCSQSGCTDGLSPSSSLIEDASGNLYGTTWQGGANCQYGYAGAGCGTVFKLVQNGDGGYSDNVLYSFCAQGGTGCPDGYQPSSGLIEDASGNLYGTTFDGGIHDVSGDGGTVFELTPSGAAYTETVLYSFCAQSSPTIACTDGSPPQGGLIEDASGNLYGTTNGGGPNSYGTVFKLSPPQPAFTVSASPTSLTIAAGQSGTATFTVAPENGFDSAVSFACSGLPAEASCSFSPQTVTPSGGKSATTTLTITTTAPKSAALRRAERGPQSAYAFLLPGLALALVGAVRGRRTRRGLRLLGLLVLLGLALASCSSSGGGSGSGGNAGTPAGTSTVTVTAGVTGGASQTATLTVTVTQ
ncbi:MAG: choice-of-anchor tandem repeat GloVer-containing protein [Candidatus Sulfotelmatobacter sp.]